MKIMLLQKLCFTTILVVFMVHVSDAQVTSDLLQEFKFNGTYTNQAGGISFASNAGTSFVTDRKGNPNSALNINNTGSIATITGLPYGSTARSISVWVKLNSFNVNNYNMLYAYGQQSAGNANGASISSTLTYHLGYNNNHDASDANTLNTWNHYVFSYDGTNSRIYKNGVLIGTNARIWNTINSSNQFKLGTGVGGELWFNGALDDLKIYNRAINLAEVNELYSGGGLVQEFKFDNSYTSQSGTATFGSNAGTSFVTDRKGNTNSAININNTGAIATITGLAYGGDARSVSLWVKVNSFNGNGYDMFYAYGQGSLSNSNGGGSSQTAAFHFGYNNNHSVSDNNTINTWNHYVFVYDGAASKIYKNGYLIGTQNIAWNTLNNNDLFKIGTGIGSELWFNGAIDDLKIYNKDLSADEVSALYGQPLVAAHEWKFDGAYTNRNGLSPFLSNSGTSFTTNRFGQSNKALAINNTGTYVNGGVSGLPSGNSPRTVSFWLSRYQTGTFQEIFVYGASGVNNCFGLNIADNETMMNYNYNFGSVYTPIASSVIPTGITWAHIAVVYTGDSAKIYRNGLLRVSAAVTTPLTTSSGSVSLLLGRVLTAASTPFNGAIDDFKIYAKALSQSEISTLYQSESVLPLNLASFTAKLNNQTTQVNWQTSQEINTSHF
ncbi:MAG: LamG domain-containing protein, partial [Chitinophagaceae bacterium]|nr:LamG domain-containing protein [Chitinophagaceae bacterium]